MRHPTALAELAPQADIERIAFNAAFHELGLRWHWCDEVFNRLATDPCDRSRVRHYLETEQAHLLRAYDADFLTDAILDAKQRCRQQLADCPPRTMPRFSWAEAGWGEVGI